MREEWWAGKIVGVGEREVAWCDIECIGVHRGRD